MILLSCMMLFTCSSGLNAQIKIGKAGKVAASVKTSYVANPSSILTTTENWRRTVSKTILLNPTDSGDVYLLSLDTFSTLDKPMTVYLGNTDESALLSLQDIEGLLHEENDSTFEIPIIGGVATVSVNNKSMQNRFYNALTIISEDYIGEVRMTRDEAQKLIKKFEGFLKNKQ